jgi:hypothetical protein
MTSKPSPSREMAARAYLQPGDRARSRRSSTAPMPCGRPMPRSCWPSCVSRRAHLARQKRAGPASGLGYRHRLFPSSSSMAGEAGPITHVRRIGGSVSGSLVGEAVGADDDDLTGLRGRTKFQRFSVQRRMVLRRSQTEEKRHADRREHDQKASKPNTVE